MSLSQQSCASSDVTSTYCSSADGENFFEVEDIVDQRVNDMGVVEYRVRWRSWTSDWDTWEPLENLETCKDIVDRFRKSRGERMLNESDAVDAVKTSVLLANEADTTAGDDEDATEQDDERSITSSKVSSNSKKRNASSAGKSRGRGGSSRGRGNRKSGASAGKRPAKSKASSKSADIGEEEDSEMQENEPRNERDEACAILESSFDDSASSSASSTGLLKDRFWKDLEMGKINIDPEESLYNSVGRRTRTRTKKSLNENEMFRQLSVADVEIDACDIAVPPDASQGSSRGRRGRGRNRGGKVSDVRMSSVSPPPTKKRGGRKRIPSITEWPTSPEPDEPRGGAAVAGSVTVSMLDDELSQHFDDVYNQNQIPFAGRIPLGDAAVDDTIDEVSKNILAVSEALTLSSKNEILLKLEPELLDDQCLPDASAAGGSGTSPDSMECEPSALNSSTDLLDNSNVSSAAQSSVIQENERQRGTTPVIPLAVSASLTGPSNVSPRQATVEKYRQHRHERELAISKIIGLPIESKEFSLSEYRRNEMKAYHSEETKEIRNLTHALLKKACLELDVITVRRALKSIRQSDITEQPDEDGNTILMQLVKRPCDPAHEVDDIMEILVQAKANVNRINVHGNTALHLAADQGDLCKVTKLLSLGAALNLPNKVNNETPLAIASRLGFAHVATRLLENGADFNAINKFDLTVLEAAKRANQGICVEILRSHMSKVKAIFDHEVQRIMDGCVKLKKELFPLHCYSLNESSLFCVSFPFDAAPFPSDSGFLLFVGLAKFQQNQVSVRFHGPCPLSKVQLNRVDLQCIQKQGKFVYHCWPLQPGMNELAVFCVSGAKSAQSKLLIQAFLVAAKYDGNR